jgi:hypothetical protein
MTTPEDLARDWLAAKRAELEATNRRIQIEQDLLKLIPNKEEGRTSTTLTNGMRVVAAGKMSYKADVERLIALTAGWPEKPIKTRVEADEAFLKAIRSDRPDLWRQIAPAVSLKPAKTYITVEEPDHGI